MIALFFDTETTGFKSSTFTPEIVQIGAILQDTETRRVLGELNIIVTAKEAIPPRVTEIHGITDELAKLYGVAGKEAELMFETLANMADVVVAHNIQFDLGIIKDAWPIAFNTLEQKQQYCTMIEAEARVGISGNHAGGTKYPKLIEAYRHFYGKEFDNQHDAMADVRACRDVYFALYDSLEKFEPGKLSDILTRHITTYPDGGTNLYFTVEPITAEIQQRLLNLIEQSKDRDLPLHWLAGEITKL